MTKADEHAAALGMVRLTIDGTNGPWWILPGRVADVEDHSSSTTTPGWGPTAVRLIGPYGHRVREPIEEVFRILAEAKCSERQPAFDTRCQCERCKAKRNGQGR
jgi:hypothetical protein